MKTLYVDNFHGFKNQYIPLKDVNFFVGENSTGKTSILNLIYLLSLPDFWSRQEFNANDIQLGNFDDVISMNSMKKYFRFGIINTDSESKENFTFLLTFKNQEGSPVISEYNYLFNDIEVKIIFLTNNRIKYKMSTIKVDNNQKKGIAEIFTKWTIDKDESGFKEYNKNKNKNKILLKDRDLLFIPYILEREEKCGDGKKLHFRFPEFFGKIDWIAPVRTKPKRTYDQIVLNQTSEGEHTPYVIKKILSSGKGSKRFKVFIKKFGKESSLFDNLHITKYGKSISSPFALDIILDDKTLNINNVGYGVSQCMPVLVDLFIKHAGSWFAIQQPEIHLHPKAQASIGDYFFECAAKENKKFFIETHSDFIIDRFRLNYKNKDKGHVESQVLFFERNKTGNNIHSIDIDSNGEYSIEQPSAFREFFIREELNLLEIR